MNLILPIYSIFLLCLLIIAFFSKKRLKTDETDFYSLLIIISFFNVSFNIIGIYLGYFDGQSFLLFLLNHLDLPLYFCWSSILFAYLLSVYLSDKINSKYLLYKKIILFSDIIFILITLFLPFEIILTKTAGYAVGICVNFVYAISGLYLISSFIISIKLIFNGKFKKTLPMITLIVMGIVAALVQKNIPSLIIVPSVAVYVLLIMYFTIENPDIKMLDEYNKNKRLAEVNIDDKTNMLFKISQDVKAPITNINEISSKMDNNNTIKDMKTDAKHINIISKDVLGQINNIFDITAMDISKIKMVNTKYNIYNLFNQLVYLTKNNLKKNIDFKYSIATNTPDMLYGDSLKLKQIIYSCIANSIKNTKEGFIDLDISSIEKYDVCRLIIKVSDSGKGMELTKINEILEDNSVTKEELNDIDSLELSLKVVKKIINIKGGTLLITSEAEEGTIITIIIDQKISNEQEKNIISDKLTNKEKVLVIDDNYKELELLKRELQRNNYIVTTTMYGKDLIDKINNGYKYSLIFIDDEMKECNAVDILSKLNNKDLKIIIMLDKDKESIKDKYLEDYNLLDYLLKSNYKQEIKRIISKYL